jgi:hypothetical protein
VAQQLSDRTHRASVGARRSAIPAQGIEAVSFPAHPRRHEPVPHPHPRLRPAGVRRAADVAGARDGDGPPDPKLAALYGFTQALVANKGHVDGHEIDQLVRAGYPREAVLTVIAQVGFTTLANLAYGVSGVPVDGPFAPQAWPPAEARL